MVCGSLKMASPSAIIMVIMLAIITTIPFSSSVISDKLIPGFYDATCPQAEKIIWDIMQKKAAEKEGIIPGIMRLHFHDCFISGCDASILTRPERYNYRNAEMGHPANSNSLRGMDVLDEIKAELERQCPGIVSCADMLAFAGRDTIVLAGNPHYIVPAGRRDTLHVDGSLADDLPKGIDSIPTLTEKYAQRDLTLEDMVVLEGAHSIGRTRCLGTIADEGSMTNATGSEQVVDKQLLALVSTTYCFGDVVDFFTRFVPLNPAQGNKNWGISFYINILRGYSVVPCDLGMAFNSTTKELVEKYAKDGHLWQSMFNTAMVKLGKVNVLTGDEGEVRRDCRYINAVHHNLI